MPRSDTRLLTIERAANRGWGVVRPERLAPLEELRLGSVLDVGCSSGGYVFEMRRRGYPAVGMDLLEDPGWGTEAAFLVGEATELPFRSASFDTILSFETLEHVSDARSALAEWRRVARRHVVLSVPNAEAPRWSRAAGLTYHHYVDRTHVQFFDEPQLRELLTEEGFSDVRVLPILPVHPFIPALAAIGLPIRVAAGLGRRLTRLSRRRYHTTLLAIASVG